VKQDITFNSTFKIVIGVYLGCHLEHSKGFGLVDSDLWFQTENNTTVRQNGCRRETEKLIRLWRRDDSHDNKNAAKTNNRHPTEGIKLDVHLQKVVFRK